MKIIYFDSENLLSYKEVKRITLGRYMELARKSFTHEEIMTIIFDCAGFKSCFFNEAAYFRLKDEFSKKNGLFKQKRR